MHALVISKSKLGQEESFFEWTEERLRKTNRHGVLLLWDKVSLCGPQLWCFTWAFPATLCWKEDDRSQETTNLGTQSNKDSLATLEKGRRQSLETVRWKTEQEGASQLRLLVSLNTEEDGTRPWMLYHHRQETWREMLHGQKSRYRPHYYKPKLC